MRWTQATNTARAPKVNFYLNSWGQFMKCCFNLIIACIHAHTGNSRLKHQGQEDPLKHSIHGNNFNCRWPPLLERCTSSQPARLGLRENNACWIFVTGEVRWGIIWNWFSGNHLLQLSQLQACLLFALLLGTAHRRMQWMYIYSMFRDAKHLIKSSTVLSWVELSIYLAS